ncbi:MAG: S24/S26 family peptidase [Lentisphaeria bacterium]|nr:S24/S26 family peptidase [Lentisphaeria bacterium]
MGNGPETPREAHYTGDSMHGTFVPGETLALAETAFEALQTGDIVAIFERSPYYVHRIVEKNETEAVTMGDNNGRPDALRLTRDSRFRLVTEARGLDGIVRQIPGGEAGMAQFRRQQRRWKLRRFASILIHPFKPLKFLRLPANTETRFRDGTVQWSFAGIPVAARTPSGRIRYLHWSKRLFFRIPAQKNMNE